MAEENGGGGGGSTLGFLLVFFGGIFMVWFLGNSNGVHGIFSGMSTSSSLFNGTTTISQGRVIETSTSGISGIGDSVSQTTVSSKPLSSTQVESQLSDAYRQVDTLKEDVETAKIWGQHSPHEGEVYIQSGNIWTTDEDSEYLSIYANSSNANPVNITGWHVESYVTGESATIPSGTRLPRLGRINDAANIMLEPGEQAYLISGEAPNGISFHENMCTGYFTQFQDYTPQVSWSCASPLEEMKRYGNIDLDDDDCYNFVQTLQSCRIPDENAVSQADLSAKCESFVDNQLNYAGCVANHRNDPYFTRGAWHIYLDHGSEMWRSQREIIKLLDENNLTVAVLRY